MAHNVVLFPHPPGEKSKAFVRGLEGEWRAYNYLLHYAHFKDMEGAVLAVVRKIDEAVDLQKAGRVLLVPPGHSAAVLPMAAAIEGLHGHLPEVLVLLRDGSGEYAPCGEKPVVSPGSIKRAIRAKRHDGVVAL